MVIGFVLALPLGFLLARYFHLRNGSARGLEELKSEFLSTVSHELRTPLTSIGGYAKLLLSGDAGPITESQREFLGIIDTNVIRLTHLINDILDVERMESEKIHLVKKPVNLDSVLRECANTFEVLARQKGLDLRYVIPKEPILVLGDRDRLVQIFMNLLSNAIKYTQAGYIEIQVHKQEEDRVSVGIHDTGIGLSEEDQKKLFQKFYRSRAALLSAERGTGLGLTIVRKLIEAHDGMISVESELGKGTGFTVVLPVSQESISKIVPIEPPVLKKRQVWIVDRNQDDINQIVKWIGGKSLQSQGYALEVRVFEKPSAVPKVSVAADLPALVIVDPHVENGEGFVIPALRKKLKYTVPIMVIGGSSDATAAFAEGASAWLTKPIDSRELLIAVKDLLAQKGWKILLVDSNTDLRILIKRALEQRGFTVDDIDQGHLVLGRLNREHYDLLLVDLGLRDVPSIELIKHIRKSGEFEDLSIFVMSLEDQNHEFNQKLQELKVDFIAKYNGLDAIANRVSSYFEEEI